LLLLQILEKQKEMSEAAELAWAAWLGYYNRWDERKESRGQRREINALEPSLDPSYLYLLNRFDYTTPATKMSLLAPFRLYSFDPHLSLCLPSLLPSLLPLPSLQSN
jgi:hypothetical protein